MNVRLTILLVVVLAIIGGSVAIAQSLRTKEPKTQEPWMYKVNEQDIASISVIHKDEQVDYALEGDHWVIKDGNDSQVFIDKWSGTTLLLSGPRSARFLADQVDDPARYGLDSPQTRVTLVDKSGYPLGFYLGDPTPDGQNWYAGVVGSPRLFTVASVWGEVVSRLASEPPYMPFKINLENINNLSVNHNGKWADYLFKDGQWVIRGEGEDSNNTPVFLEKWASTTPLLNSPKYSRAPVERIDDPAKYGLASPQTEVLIGDKKGKVAEVHLGSPTPDGENWYARLKGSEELFTVASVWGEAVSRLASEPPYPPTLGSSSAESASAGQQAGSR